MSHFRSKLSPSLFEHMLEQNWKADRVGECYQDYSNSDNVKLPIAFVHELINDHQFTENPNRVEQQKPGVPEPSKSGTFLFAQHGQVMQVSDHLRKTPSNSYQDSPINRHLGTAYVF